MANLKAVAEIKRLESAIEAILFAAGDPVKTDKISEAIGCGTETVEKIIHDMMGKYQAATYGIQIVESENGFQLCAKPEYYEYLIKIAKQPRKMNLSNAALETLSVIAYKQPVTKSDIEKIRGVKSDHAVNTLIEYNLVEELGRLDAPGRPILFGTTDGFLRAFGLQSLSDLPSVGQAQASSQDDNDVQLKLDV